MDKLDYIYGDQSGHEIHVVALVPNEPKRLLLIPPLVGANGTYAIRTFRYFFRENSSLMSFDYCGHYNRTSNNFTLLGTFADTKVALFHGLEYARKMRIPMHVVGACYGLIPLICILNEMAWPREVRSMFSVAGLFSIQEILNFDGYNLHLKERGLIFKNRAEFVDFMTAQRNRFLEGERKYIEALTDYLLKIFTELSGAISYKSFGVLEYSRVEFYTTFYEFMTMEVPELVVPEYVPSLFFTGIHDTVLNLRAENGKGQYLKRIKQMAPHAEFCNLRIDHFGRGEDHYVIGQEAMRFLIKTEKQSLLDGPRDGSKR